MIVSLTLKQFQARQFVMCVLTDVVSGVEAPEPCGSGP